MPESYEAIDKLYGWRAACEPALRNGKMPVPGDVPAANALRRSQAVRDAQKRKA